jgi:N-acetylmuramoyl-L-alanine amidase
MRGTARYVFLKTLGFWAFGTLCLPAAAAEIRGMQLSINGEVTRAVFDISAPLDYKLFEIANPDRIVLDLHGSSFADGFTPPTGKGLLKGVRTGKQGKTDVRVVFDLAAGVRPKSFLQPATAKVPCRLIVELTPRAKSRAEIVKSAQIPAEKTRDVVIAIDAGHGGAIPVQPARPARTRRKLPWQLRTNLSA